jgi:hypothetical protein
MDLDDFQKEAKEAVLWAESPLQEDCGERDAQAFLTKAGGYSI